MVFGREIANLCSQNGYKNPIIYYLDNNPGVSISNSFELYCNKLGISIGSRESFDLNTDSMEFDRIIRRWKNNFAFDSIFITGRMPIIKDKLTFFVMNPSKIVTNGGRSAHQVPITFI